MFGTRLTLEGLAAPQSPLLPNGLRHPDQPLCVDMSPVGHGTCTMIILPERMKIILIIRSSNSQFETDVFGGFNFDLGELFRGCSSFELNLAKYLLPGSIFLKRKYVSFC